MYNVLFGIIALFVVVYLESTVWYPKTCVNGLYDHFVAIEAHSLVRSNNRESLSERILLVDIDDSAYRKWGRPDTTPRDQLAKLIWTAYENGAKVIVVDVSVEEKDYSPAATLNLPEALSGEERDNAMKELYDIERSNSDAS